MAELREKCREVLTPFVQAYSELCNDLKLEASKVLYIDISKRFLDNIPEEVTRLPYSLKDQKIQHILDASINRSGKSSKDAAALALQRMIILCKKHGLINGRVMINKRMRPEELAIHDESAFVLLDDFIDIRQWLCGRIQIVPRQRKDLSELTIAALIAVNGICSANAHLRISSCQQDHLKTLKHYPTLDVPTSRYLSKAPPTIRYPLLPEIETLLQHLKSNNRWLYPNSFNPDTWNHRDRRTKAMNKWLDQLWVTVFGKDHCVPKQWTIRTFIACSRLFITLNSAPIVAGFLSGKATFASIDVMDSAVVANAAPDNFAIIDVENPDKHHDETSTLIAKELIESINNHLGSYHRKRQDKGTKKAAATHLLAISAVYFDLLHQLPCLRHLIRWMIWELERDGNKRKMGSLQALWRFIPASLLDELGNEDPAELDSGQWLRLVEYFIQENTLAPATRSKIKQHLKAFHEYLCREFPEVPRLNWRRGELKVYTEQGGGIFPSLSEFDLLFNLAGQEKNPAMRRQLQAALTLAFFGGLRAEEICLLSKMDIDPTTIQVRVWWSKTRQGRRRLPLMLLTPAKYIKPVWNLQKKCHTSQSLLFGNGDGRQVLPDTLAKRIKKLIIITLPKDREMSIHTLRHGFASWLLIRYFALHEQDLLTSTHANGKPIIPDANHEVFSHAEQKKLVRVFNGRSAGEAFEGDPSSFLSKPEHFAYISKLIGHATRDTTARTYVHSMEWLAYYYLNKLSTHYGPT
ncbi:MAG: site-specific integrase [Mariprofundaceae bacterium]|nr:site-specific integrase [Mariprofundaceae bacterium]